MHEIRIADEKDGDAIKLFIDQQWKKDHIFVTNKELFDWQHLDRKRRKYNFVIGVEKKTQQIHGVLGLIPLSQFDPEIEYERLCWMVIWKTHEDARGHRLGRRLLGYLDHTIKPDIISTIAASTMTLSMYQAKGYHTGLLDQYFILNPNIKSFQLVSFKNSKRPDPSECKVNKEKKLEQASENDIMYETEGCFNAQKDLPRKSPSYLVNRYFRHPIYQYQTYKILEGGQITGAIVTRICSSGGARAIRIVDFIGPSSALCGLREQWRLVLGNVDAEYIDFYCSGIDKNDILSSGFISCKTEDSTIIPNYFEPFSKERIDISYMTSVAEGRNFRIVKGDSDQDRPNIVA